MTKMNNPKFTTPSGDTAPRQVWQQTVDAVLAQTKSQAAGLSSADAAERLNSCGPNALPEKKGKPTWLRFLAHFNDVLIYVLLAAAALTAIMGHWVDTLVILGVTVINALIGHIQESNAEKSLQGIRNMLSSDARVQRNGKHETIPTRDLVPGDIVILRAGGGHHADAAAGADGGPGEDHVHPVAQRQVALQRVGDFIHHRRLAGEDRLFHPQVVRLNHP